MSDKVITPAQLASGRYVTTSDLVSEFGLSGKPAFYRLCSLLGLDQLHVRVQGQREWAYPAGEARKRLKRYQAAKAKAGR